jgi:hypothetical protein
MPVVEIVRFRLAADTDEREFLDENANVERDYISAQPGVIDRETATSTEKRESSMCAARSGTAG